MSATAPAELRSQPHTVPADNRTLGWAALEWTAKWLRQPDGAHAGEPWQFTLEQAGIVLRWYEIDERGRFPARRGVLRRMKGWGKDPFAAALAAVELCGPCRFDYWDAAGLPVAKAHPAPWVQIAAVSQDQTRNTMTLFPALFSPECIKEYRLDIGKTIIYLGRGGQIEAVTSSPRALEGKRTSFTIKNESHLWVQSNDGLAMDQAINRNLAKSNDGSARSLEITNAHLPGEESVAEVTYDAWQRASGDVPGLYYDSLEAPEIKDLRDRDPLIAALTVARGDSAWLDLERLADEVADPVTPEWLSRRYYLNQVVAVDADRWMPMDAWDARARPEQKIERHADVVLAFDGSFNGDCTALLVCELREIPHLEVVELWENRGDPNWRVPIEDVEERIREAAKEWRVREIPADTYRWARSMEILEKERLPIVEFPQRPARMIPATTRLYEAVVNEGMTHSGDSRLRLHVANAVLKVGSQGGHLTKDSKSSTRRIDLAVCAVMAFDRAAQYRPRTPGVVDLNEVMAEMTADELDLKLDLEDIDDLLETQAEGQDVPAGWPDDRRGSGR